MTRKTGRRHNEPPGANGPTCGPTEWAMLVEKRDGVLDERLQLGRADVAEAAPVQLREVLVQLSSSQLRSKQPSAGPKQKR